MSHPTAPDSPTNNGDTAPHSTEPLQAILSEERSHLQDRQAALAAEPQSQMSADNKQQQADLAERILEIDHVLAAIKHRSHSH